jgi:hypothetical protein
MLYILVSSFQRIRVSLSACWNKAFEEEKNKITFEMSHNVSTLFS